MSQAQKALKKLLKTWDLSPSTLGVRSLDAHSDAQAWFSLSERERQLLERGIRTEKGLVRYQFDGKEIQVSVQ